MKVPHAVYYHSLHCGHRQVVRPQLPKLVFAGSNPVARSIAFDGRRPLEGRRFCFAFRFGALHSIPGPPSELP